MNYREIEQYFVSDEQIEKLLGYCDEHYFSKIDLNADKFTNDFLTSPEDINKSLDELTGMYMNLSTIYSIASTLKENEELKFYTKRRLEIEGEGKKFMSSSTDKEASLYVSNYRRVRNILESYILKTEKAISTCQSRLKYISKEMDLTK